MKFGLKVVPVAPKQFIAAVFAALLALPAAAERPAPDAAEKPQALIGQAVDDLLAQFTAQREQLVDDNRALFALVDRVAAPLFDFERIAKLVLAQHWRRADAGQRAVFSGEFRKLLIATYATALHKYSGNERMAFTASEITERKGRKFAKVASEVTLGDGAEPIAVNYSLLLDQGGHWKIYNLAVGGLDMIVNYRKTYAELIGQRGIDSVLADMKRANAENYGGG